MREDALNASRDYYAHQALCEDYMAQRRRRLAKLTRLELDFIEFAFHNHATHLVKDVLDIACGGGRHMIGLAHRGYKCTGLDYTPERIQVAKVRAESENVPVKLLQGYATRLEYENEFDAVIALYILFLLPNDDDVLKCLRQIHRSLRPGGIFVCNIGNPLYEGKDWFALNMVQRGSLVQEISVKGMRYSGINTVQDFDPIHGVVWWQETSIIEDSDGVHIFRDRERLRLFTYLEFLNYLQLAGFKNIQCYPDWETQQQKKIKGEKLVFVSHKD